MFKFCVSITVFYNIWDTQMYMMHTNFRRANQEKKTTNIKRNENNIMNIIFGNTFNQYNTFWNNDNKYMEVILKSMLMVIVR